jgi:site-specific DNA recombinase
MSTKSAIAYVRISNDPKDIRAGVERQREDVAAMAVDLDADLVAIYEDNDIGAWRARRADTQWGAVLAAVARDRPDYLLVGKMDRLGRRLADLEGLEELCRASKTTVVSKVEGDVFAFAAWPVLAAVAKMESTNTSLRVSRAQETRRANGLSVNGGTRPFGYQPDRVTVVEEEAKILRELVLNIITNGASIASCVRLLNDRKIPTVQGGKWTVNRVSAVLHNPRYGGRLVNKGKEIGAGNWEPIIPLETWHRLQAVLEQNARAQRGPSNTTLLGGLAHCSVCGAPMYSNGVGVYRCFRNKRGCVSRAMKLLDAYVVAYMLDRYSEDLVGADKASARARVRFVRAEANKLSFAVQDATTAWQEGRVAETRAFLDALSTMRRRQDRLNKELAEAQMALDVASGDRLAAEHWEAWTMRQRRRWLAQRIDLVIVRPGGRGSRILDPSTVTIHPKPRT